MTNESSEMIEPGTKAPGFELTDVVSGETVSLEDFSDKKAMLVMFICRHCPYVKHIQQELSQFAKQYQTKDIGIVAISANDPEEYPEDAPGSLKEQAEQMEFAFPYLFDETQEIAKAYSAQSTPEFFLFDQNRRLVYRGQFDDTRPGGDRPTGKDLRAAVDAVLNDEKVPQDQKPAVGCSIKWKKK